jgi:hypothetical protein
MTDRAHRDERTLADDDAGYRWSYLVLSFGLLVVVALRSLRQGEASWDLLSLVVLGGLVNVAYQGVHGTLRARRAAVTVVVMVSAAAAAAAAVWLGR